MLATSSQGFNSWLSQGSMHQHCPMDDRGYTAYLLGKWDSRSGIHHAYQSIYHTNLQMSRRKAYPYPAIHELVCSISPKKTYTKEKKSFSCNLVVDEERNMYSRCSFFSELSTKQEQIRNSPMYAYLHRSNKQTMRIVQATTGITCRDLPRSLSELRWMKKERPEK